MTIKLVINIAKKVPGPQEFSSVQASCSIEAECSTGDPVAEAAALYLQAEAAVDHQLRLTPFQAAPVQPSTGSRLPYADHRPRAKQPPPRPLVQRAPPLATQSQLNLLSRLMSEQPGRLDAILHHFQIGSLQQLTVAQASEVIDQLKQGSA
jgi:hypothetical protein